MKSVMHCASAPYTQLECVLRSVYLYFIMCESSVKYMRTLMPGVKRVPGCKGNICLFLKLEQLNNRTNCINYV